MDSQKLFQVSVTVALAVVGLIYAKAVLVPFVIALLAAYLITALSRRVAARLPANAPPWVADLGAFLVLILGAAVIFQVLSANLESVVERAPRYESNLLGLLRDAASLFGLDRMPSVDWLLSQLAERTDLQSVLTGLLNSVTGMVTSTFIVLLYTAFLLVERRTLRHKWLRIQPNEAERRRHHQTLREIGHRVEQYVFLKTAISLGVAVTSWIAMEAIGLDFASFWALLIFAFNFIPYIGSPIAVAFPVLLSLVQFQGFSHFVVALPVLGGLQVLFGNIIEPRVLGRSLNLSPTVILLSLAAWGAVWGPIGALLSVPITVIATIAMSQVESMRPVAVLLSRNGDL